MDLKCFKVFLGNDYGTSVGLVVVALCFIVFMDNYVDNVG